MKFILLLAVVLGIAALQQGAQASKLCLSTICGSSNELRGSDNCGSGHYNARRGNRKHRGVDIKCADSSTVYSPFEAKILREAKPDSSSATYSTGLLLEGIGSWSDFKVWMFYFEKSNSVNYGDKVNGGDTIGTMLDMTGKCTPGMTNHIHLMLKKNDKVVNPEDYLC